jgi:hypothetical protein
MDGPEDGSTAWLPIAEAAPRLGLTVDGVRSRIRRGLVTTRKGNDGRTLVAIFIVEAANGHDQSLDASKPVTHDQVSHDEADELRAEVVELRVKLARVEERLNASERREMDLQIRVDDLRTERDQLGFDLAEARKPLLLRLLEALRRR